MKTGERFNAKAQRRGVIHLTMKNMKGMKIIHESVNKRANGRVHSLTPFFDSFRVISCLSWLRKGFPLCLCVFVREKGF